MADFIANLVISMVYHGIVAAKKLLKPIKIVGSGPGKLERKLRAKLKEQGWKK